jgi:hypothetical protein
MHLKVDDLQERYRAMSKDEFASVNRAELANEAQNIYDRGEARRQAAPRRCHRNLRRRLALPTPVFD